MSSITHRPPFDAETEASMNAIAEQLPVITPEMIASLREVPLPVSFSEELLAEHDAVAVSVEYRLAPEFPDPCPVKDCYAGLVWTAANAAQLGLDPQRLMIAGASAGGGLAAGTTLIARDRRGPQLTGQLLDCPMVDDRDATVSTGSLAAGAFGDHALPVRDPARDADCCVSQRHDDRAPDARRDRHLDGSRRGAVVLEPCGDRHAPHRA